VATPGAALQGQAQLEDDFPYTCSATLRLSDLAQYVELIAPGEGIQSGSLSAAVELRGSLLKWRESAGKMTLSQLKVVRADLPFENDGPAEISFGPEGVRTQSLVDYSAMIAGTPVSGETLLIVASAAFFSFLLYLFFNFTLTGKALHATAMNRTGARLMGIRPQQSGTIAFLLGSLLAAVSGVLIAPVNTIFYDSGFLIGLKAFVGAIIGGLVSFPVTAIGSVLVGVLESFAAFQSSPFKEVIVFSVLIPVLLWRSWSFVHADEEDEE